MAPEDFDRLQAMLSARAGFRLTRDRMKLAEHRLGPVARREGFETVEAMLGALWARPTPALGWAVIEALLNPETWFRRDRASFDVFADELLPALAKSRGGQPVRIWSAGCGSGQEVWSLSMAAQGVKVPVEITGTDVSQKALEKARAGAYTGFEIQRGLSAGAMLAWFDQVEDAWVASRDLRQNVRFARANLLEPPKDDFRFDIIFCRNVLTDMDPAKRTVVLDNLERRLADDGCLFLGSGEAVDTHTVAFQPVVGRQGLYVKSPAGLSRAA